MAQEFSRTFYNSKAWIQCKKAYIKSVNGLCERCLKKGKLVPGYIVHHKVKLTPSNINNPNITLNFDNLELLCLDCHNWEHMGKYGATAEGIKFNNNGDVVSI